MKTPRDLLDTQLVEMESKNDALNAELAEVNNSTFTEYFHLCTAKIFEKANYEVTI